MTDASSIAANGDDWNVSGDFIVGFDVEREGERRSVTLRIRYETHEELAATIEELWRKQWGAAFASIPRRVRDSTQEQSIQPTKET